MANENPSGLGNFTCNLRFPGQYFDKETNTHYNYYRDYSPDIGRYVEADPLGVLTTKSPTPTTRLNHLYTYVDSNPLSRIDPTGQGWEAIIIPVVAVGGSFYCYIRGIRKCQEMYPKHKDREHPDFANFIQCTTGISKVITLEIGISADPIAGGASATGEALGKQFCESCEH